MSYLISVLVIAVGIMAVCIVCPTASERANQIDKTGRTTGVNWR